MAPVQSRTLIVLFASVAFANCTCPGSPSEGDGGTADGGVPFPPGSDSGVTPDAGSDSGTEADAGPDASVPFDSGSLDAGIDAGSEFDSGSAIDAGSDAGGTKDAGEDAGLASDSGAQADAGHDAGTALDAGGIDAGHDAGLPDAGSDAGCMSTMALVGGGSPGTFATLWSSNQWASLTTSATPVASSISISTYGSGYIGAFEGSNSQLLFLAYAGTWTAPAQIASATTQGAPSTASLASDVHIIYWGSDTKFYHGTYASGAWDSASDPVGGSTNQSLGFSAPTVDAVSGTLVVTQAGEDSNLYAQTWSGSSWQAAVQISGVTLANTITPRIIALQGGSADVLIVFARQTDNVLFYTVRDGSSGTWSTPAMVVDTTVFSPNPVSLAALPSGKAILLYEGGNGQPYFSAYGGTGALPWSSVQAMFSTANPSLSSPPSVATGVCGNDAVATFVASTGDVYVSNWVSGAWTMPVMITNGATFAAIGTHP
jgi:hypothetical protein